MREKNRPNGEGDARGACGWRPDQGDEKDRMKIAFWRWWTREKARGRSVKSSSRAWSDRQEMEKKKEALGRILRR